MVLLPWCYWVQNGSLCDSMHWTPTKGVDFLSGMQKPLEEQKFERNTHQNQECKISVPWIWWPYRASPLKEHPHRDPSTLWLKSSHKATGNCSGTVRLQVFYDHDCQWKDWESWLCDLSGHGTQLWNLRNYEVSAKGVYHPKNYTKHDKLRALLLWQLSGIHVAQTNHCAQGDPSLTKQLLSFTSSITPSPGQPTVAEIVSNVKTMFEGVLKVVHNWVKLLHTVIMFNELETEKRIWWDQKTNHFLSVCWEHAHKTSLEFVNKGDMEELFWVIDNDEVHCWHPFSNCSTWHSHWWALCLSCLLYSCLRRFQERVRQEAFTSHSKWNRWN